MGSAVFQSSCEHFFCTVVELPRKISLIERLTINVMLMHFHIFNKRIKASV